jgi:hypothetical protein
LRLGAFAPHCYREMRVSSLRAWSTLLGSFFDYSEEPNAILLPLASSQAAYHRSQCATRKSSS